MSLILGETLKQESHHLKSVGRGLKSKRRSSKNLESTPSPTSFNESFVDAKLNNITVDVEQKVDEDLQLSSEKKQFENIDEFVIETPSKIKVFS